MIKNVFRALLTSFIIFAAYNLVVFVAPFPGGKVFWISYAFTLVSFMISGISFLIAFGKPNAKSRFYGFPIAKVGLIYAAAQLVVGLVAMILGPVIPAWIVIILYGLGLCVASLGLIGTEAVRDSIEAQDKKLKVDTALMQDLRSKVIQMANQCESRDAVSALKKFSDEIRYSDPVSNPALKEIEGELTQAVYQLQDAVVDGDCPAVCQLCEKATLILNERNRLCKLNKS